MRSKDYERKLLARARARHSIEPIPINVFESQEKQESATNINYESRFSELLLERLKRGDTVKDFCKELGISRSKFYRWLAKHT